MKKRNMAFVSLLFAALLVTAARADNPAHRVILNVLQPVEIPGHVLQPGRYDLTLWDTSNGINLVRVSCHDQKCQYGWFPVTPVERKSADGTSRVDVEEPAGTSMERIKDWFPEGERDGYAFEYARHRRHWEQEPSPGSQ